MNKKIVFNGKEIEVCNVEVIMADEHWDEYTLANGDVLRVKDIVINVVKAINEKTVDGKPIYMISSQRIIALKE